MPWTEHPDDWVDFGHLDALAEAALVLTGEGSVAYANSAAQRLVGVGSLTLNRTSAAEAIFTVADRGAFREAAEQARGGIPWLGELEVLRADDSTVRAEVSCAAIRRAGAPLVLLCVLNEVSGARSRARVARRLADRMTSLAKVAAELAVAEDLDTVTKVVISEAADAVGATVGSLSLLVDEDTLALAGLRGGLEGAAARWTRYSVHDATPAGDVVRHGQPLVLLGRAAIQERYPRLERAADG
jgi:PAS domain S-box-containing protein